MSIYHFDVGLIRRHEGGIALERSAYQARQRLTCLATGEVYDHTEKDDLVNEAVVGTELTREELWTMAELAENRYKVVVARNIKVALPVENTAERNWSLLLNLATHVSAKYDTIVDVAYHRKDSEDIDANDHGHLQFPTRRWDESTHQFGHKIEELSNPRKGSFEVRELRQTWETMVNASVPDWAPRVSCKSHRDKGDGLIPKLHLGRVATEMERRGKPTIRGLYNDAVERCNNTTIEVAGLEAALARVTTIVEEPNLPLDPSRDLELAASEHQRGAISKGSPNSVPPPCGPDKLDLVAPTLEEDLAVALEAAAPSPGPTHKIFSPPTPVSLVRVDHVPEGWAPLIECRSLDDELCEALAVISHTVQGPKPP